MNWSGGKDSSLALHKILQENPGSVPKLLTSVNSTHDRVSMHGVRRTLLEKQASALQIPLDTIELPEQPGMDTYNALMEEKMRSLYAEGFRQGIFGDINLEDLRRYREEKMQEVNITAVFPLWQIDTRTLAEQFVGTGFKAIVVCVNEKWLDASFCGRQLDEQFLRDLPPGVDPCGENGEYHSFVYDGPLFKHPVSYTHGETVRRTYTAPAANSQSCFTTDADKKQDCFTTPADNSYGFFFHDLLP